MVAVAIVGLVSGCTKEIASHPNSTDVRRQIGVIGQPVDNFGIHVTVLRIDPDSQSSGRFPRLLISIRSESKRSAPWQNPDLTVRCDHAKESDDWFDTATGEPSAPLPADQVSEGQVEISFPSKLGADRYPVASCTNARVVLTSSDPVNRDRQIVTSYPVPTATVLASYNAAVG
jgi:hypothetical protein